jgi:2-keto-4-pentenoate hydratase/2-oxohepta-3-ene-1,7-dioic acid hydratase in catechol pathway
MGADGTAAIAPGDTVEIHVTGIGTLRNRVVAEA